VEERLWREWSTPLPPTFVVSESVEPREFPLSIPSEAAQRSASVQIRWEDGSRAKYELRLEELGESARAEFREQSYVRKRAPLPAKLPLGYHEVQVNVRLASRKSLQAAMRLIVCPDRAYIPPELAGEGKTAGIAASLYGVRSARNWGCGDFTDLRTLIDWVTDDIGASFIALNPLHAIHNRQPYNTSPYLPNSTFYKNLIYVDVERIEDFQASRRARTLLASPGIQSEIEELRAAPFVEYERVQKLKMEFLRLAFDTFLKKSKDKSPRAAEFQKYCENEDDLLDLYATYCALDEWIHEQHPDIWIWTDWPEEYRDPESKAVRAFARRRQRAISFFKYVQWQAELQLAETQRYAKERGLSIGLYHDLALATDRYGSDLWAHRPFFAAKCRVGSPPDDFSPNGQDWGFPPPNAEHHRETGYRLFVKSIRQNCQHGGALRIDHVMRFFRLFWIPDGMDPAQGAYVKDHHEDLVRILALESVRHKVVIVGEDLGTVQPSVREALKRFGILSYRLLYFEKRDDKQFRLPDEYPHQALVSATTHDLPTLAGFWLNRDIEARRNAGILNDDTYHAQLADRAREKQKMLDLLFRLGLLPDWFSRNAAEVHELTGELHNAFVGFLASTRSMLMALNQEDLLKETEQQNLPGTTSEYPNWRRKMKFTVEELRSERPPRDFTAMLRNWLLQSGRTKEAS
jgi:4-alpha-glucanotransferase